MSEALQVFTYPATQAQIRLAKVDDNGVPWFVAKDVCQVLGLANVSKTLGRLPSREKGITKGYTLGGPQEIAVINEPGLYRLIVTSNKPAAEPFSDWVFEEVLPSIRKTGQYSRNGGDTNQQILAAIQAQTVLLTELATDFRALRQGTPVPNLTGSLPPYITEEQRQELIRLARLVRTPGEVWAEVRAHFRFLNTVRLFQSVFTHQFEAVRNWLIAARPVPAPVPDNVSSIDVGPPPFSPDRDADPKHDMDIRSVAQRLKKDADVDVQMEALSCKGGVYEYLKVPPLRDPTADTLSTKQPAAFLDESRYAHVLHGFRTNKAALVHIARLALGGHQAKLEVLKARSGGRR
jgi:prophage antirepressor-like protein